MGVHQSTIDTLLHIMILCKIHRLFAREYSRLIKKIARSCLSTLSLKLNSINEREKKKHSSINEERILIKNGMPYNTIDKYNSEPFFEAEEVFAQQQ